MSRPQPQAWVSCAPTLARSSRRGESLQQLTKMKSLLLVRKHAHTSLSEDQTLSNRSVLSKAEPQRKWIPLKPNLGVLPDQKSMS